MEGKAEVGCRILESLEVQCEKRIVAIPEQRFNQREGRDGMGEELGLEQALAIFVGGLGVDDDAAAHAETGAAALERESPNGYTEDRLLPREKTDGSGVDAARLTFNFRKQLHCADLRRSRDGAAGEKRPQRSADSNFGS